MVIFHVITGLEQGGAETTLFRLVSSTDSRFLHVVVSLQGDGVFGSRLRSAGIVVHTLNMPRGRVTIAGLQKLYTLFRAERPDLVQTWMYHSDLIGGVVARMAGISIVLWGIRNSNLDSEKTSLSTRLVARLCAGLSSWVPTMIISCSQYAVEVHQSMGYVKSKFIVISNGYDLSSFVPRHKDRVGLRGEWNVKEDEILIGCVARWDPQKDYANLLAALSKVSSSYSIIKCVLVGRGMDADNDLLVDMIDQYGLRDSVILTGSRDDIPAVMNALDLYVSSSSFGEAFPNVVSEAMACGTPCVVTDVGDSALIVGETGWVVPPADSVALAEAIQTALVELKVRGREVLGVACRKRIEDNFSLTRMVASYITLWQSLQLQGK